MFLWSGFFFFFFFFQNIFPPNIFSETVRECQLVWVQIMSVLSAFNTSRQCFKRFAEKTLNANAGHLK